MQCNYWHRHSLLGIFFRLHSSKGAIDIYAIDLVGNEILIVRYASKDLLNIACIREGWAVYITRQAGAAGAVAYRVHHNTLCWENVTNFCHEHANGLAALQFTDLRSASQRSQNEYGFRKWRSVSSYCWVSCVTSVTTCVHVQIHLSLVNSQNITYVL